MKLMKLTTRSRRLADTQPNAWRAGEGMVCIALGYRMVEGSTERRGRTRYQLSMSRAEAARLRDCLDAALAKVEESR